ncbi:MAG: hypothetical protein R2748_27310 [Bryobacterales bacterium]
MLRLIPFALILATVCTAGEHERSFTMAAISVTPKEWDKEANYKTLERYAREAAAHG